MPCHIYVSGRWWISGFSKINKIIWEDQRLSIKITTDMVKIDREAVRQILPDQLNIKKVCENGPQKSYSGAERQPKKNCSDILKCINAQMNLLEKFITFAEKN